MSHYIPPYSDRWLELDALRAIREIKPDNCVAQQDERGAVHVKVLQKLIAEKELGDAPKRRVLAALGMESR